ncbi:MAG: hypothetical protein U0793_10890 [Gemmataceae bacterium]
MLYWLVDRAFVIYVLLGLVALGFGLAYRNRRDRASVIGLLACVALAALLWVLTLVVVSDRQQIERNLHALADAVLKKKPEDLKKLLAPDFSFRTYDREAAATLGPSKAEQYKIQDISLSHLSFEDVSRAEGKAKVFFNAAIQSGLFDYVAPTQCEAEFVLQNGKWLMRKIEVYGPVGRAPLQF